MEELSRFFCSAGSRLLERVVAGTLRFRLLRGRPSHEKLYLLAGPFAHYVLDAGVALVDQMPRPMPAGFASSGQKGCRREPCGAVA